MVKGRLFSCKKGPLVRQKGTFYFAIYNHLVIWILRNWKISKSFLFLKALVIFFVKVFCTH